METYRLKIGSTPAVIYGEDAKKAFLFVHGQHGCKEEAESFAALACPKGYQVVSVDLPEHGERKGETGAFNPWHAVPELKEVMEHIMSRWSSVSLRANSIGAWFCLLAFKGCRIEKSLFVSPILDMGKLISGMMAFAGVDERRLEQEKIIPTDFGNDLSWKYLQYVRANTIDEWSSPTAVLYADADDLTSRETVDSFVNRFNCSLTVMQNGEHWFHTPQQLEFLDEWTKNQL